MADQGKKDQHSSLELLKHDITANAPEHDRLVEAPELDRFAEAPELDPCVLAPESVPDTLSGAHSTGLGNQAERQALTSSKGNKTGFDLSDVSRKVWIALCVGLAIMAIGIGLGVGISTSTRDSTTSTPTTTGLTHGILDDSSIAAVSASDGTRYVFFQDTNRSFRQALYSQTTHSWAADMSLVIPGSVDARINTPLSATINVADDGSDEIFLFYIAINNSLAAKWYVSGQWATILDTDFVNLASFVASPHSRSLSVGIVPNSNISELCLLFEESGSNVTVLYGLKDLGEVSKANGMPIELLNSANKPLWTWQNITRNVTSLSNASAWNSPFTIGLDRSLKGPILDALFYSPRAVDPYSSNTIPSDGVLWSVYFNGSFDLNALPSSFISKDQFPTQDAAVKTDLIVANTYMSTDLAGKYMLWVNATTLIIVALAALEQISTSNSPLSPFPFARMATTTPASSRAFYLYHQLNKSILAEDVWDSGRLAWTSSNISVAIV